jgi:hypothetical protein
MDATVQIWLFGGCAAGIASAFAFAWAGHHGVAKCREEFYQYRLHAAEYFASFSHTSALETRTVSALNEIKQSLKEQSIKLDRLVER